MTKINFRKIKQDIILYSGIVFISLLGTVEEIIKQFKK